MKNKQSPIFIKTFDFMKWILGRTETFPKSQRFFLAKRINDGIFDFYEALIDAAALDGSRLNANLRRADAILIRIRHYVRLAMEMKYMNMKQYEFAAAQMDEIGRILGGWLKKTKKDGKQKK